MGCLVAVILIVFLVVCLVWYQVFRRSDVTEETSRESAFDFSKKRMEGTNPMTGKDPQTNTSDIRSDTGSEVGNTAKNTSPQPKGELDQSNSIEKSNGKDETVL